MNKDLYEYIINKKHHSLRRKLNIELAEKFNAEGMSPEKRMCERFKVLAKAERPVILHGEKICFIRTVVDNPEIFTPDEVEKIRNRCFIHEHGLISNITPNYERVLKKGLLDIKKEADTLAQQCIESIIELSDRYKEEAIKNGRSDIAAVLERVPRYPAGNFREALQFFRIMHYALWLEGNYHITIGRFDQYMYPYFHKDICNGTLSMSQAQELLEDFFISFNKDNDLYRGIQQGDNGQSLMLGGIAEKGGDGFNELSRLCLEASKNLKLIDPKINVRVNKNTPDEIYTLCSQLTAVGLGFPQYSNDDVIIDGLKRLGYDEKDAENYTVAACWEPIIPNCGTDIPNIVSFSFPAAVNECVYAKLLASQSFDEFMDHVTKTINTSIDKICNNIKNVWFVPSPFMNAVMGFDASRGGKYNNFGIHGVGLSSAADSLASIKKYVFEEALIDKQELIKALKSNFKLHPEYMPLLRYEAPKFGNDNDFVDLIAIELLECFSQSLKGKKNCRGGCYRAGTGSAMCYVTDAAVLGATADGRKAGEYFGANLSPGIFAKVNGPVSVINSALKLNFKDAVNGGPLTMEFHNSVFAEDDGAFKVGQLVKSFIRHGGHQLQLNAINAETLKDAKKHPEKYPRLIVRVWGWSAYFNDLDEVYKDHIIRRQEYMV